MAKERQIFFCKECGFETSKWTGQCPGCHEWNTMVESPKPVKKGNRGSSVHMSEKSMPSKITEVGYRLRGQIYNQNRRAGQSIRGRNSKGVTDACRRRPGIGKSTLLLQMCRNLAEAGH